MMNLTAQAQHVVNRIHGSGRMAHYRPVDYKCRMPCIMKAYSSFFFRLKIFVRSMKMVNAVQNTTMMPKVIQVAFKL